MSAPRSGQGAGFRGRRAISILALESVIPVIAQTLAMALVLASPGARPAVEPLPDNAVRARRGLLPRKAAKPRPASRVRRAVMKPPAPTWLGEPGQVTEPVPEPPAVAASEVAAEPVLTAHFAQVPDHPVTVDLPAAPAAPVDLPAPRDLQAADASAELAGAAALAPEVAPAEEEPVRVALASVPVEPAAVHAGATPEEPAPLSAALEGVELAWLMVRRVHEEDEGAGVHATVAGVELEVVVRRPVEPE